ncbi:MAG: M23 family metallopeptidase [Ardenticatenaceae bacterium]|nr:M23 family metallopeptidase [Anaerolineales bacterium]MCB8973008.1 M23 family metallopeptidase [Ardenticatenaceae bacterium]
MSPYLRMVQWLPDWFRIWIQTQVLPSLGLQPQMIVTSLFRGFLDSFLFVTLATGLLAGGRYYLEGQYALPSHIQDTVIKWAPIADHIAREADIPREVPLVLWFKENSMKAENPASCTGIIGAYDLVRSGQRPCFTPGPISDLEVSEQLALAASEFKIRCPEITYLTQDPDTIKRCYFAYNAGTGAASRLDANESAYVMNNYNENYTNMVYSDVELGTVTVTALGAWPTHLAFQSLIVGQMDVEERPFSLSILNISTQIYDLGTQAWRELSGTSFDEATTMKALPNLPQPNDDACLGEPHAFGRFSLRPRLNPVTEDPLLTQHMHGCDLGLPGVDISNNNLSAVLQAPMSGELTTYTDQFFNTTIRIENDEWIIWLLHPRSYFVEEGTVTRGQAVGMMGAIGYASGPHVHYTIFDKVNETFVDPLEFIP